MYQKRKDSTHTQASSQLQRGHKMRLGICLVETEQGGQGDRERCPVNPQNSPAAARDVDRVHFCLLSGSNLCLHPHVHDALISFMACILLLILLSSFTSF